MQKEINHLKTLKERKDNLKISPIEISYRSVLIEYLKNIDVKSGSCIALSVSTGDGLSDHLVFSNSGGLLRKSLPQI